MERNGSSKLGRVVDDIDRRLRMIESYIGQEDWFRGPSKGRSVYNWGVVVLVPAVVVLVGTPIMNDVFGSHDTRLHVGIREIVEVSVEQDVLNAQELGDGQGGEPVQYEYEISIANVGSSEASEESGNTLVVEFGEEISDIYALPRRGAGDRPVPHNAAGFETCKGEKKCEATWSTLGPRGILSVRFAFSNGPGKLQYVPHIVSGMRAPTKWMCCGLSPDLERKCDALSERDLYSLFESDDWFTKDGCTKASYSLSAFEEWERGWSSASYP